MSIFEGCSYGFPKEQPGELRKEQPGELRKEQPGELRKA